LAKSLGWAKPVLVDDDLGTTASGFAQRLGFERLLADIALRKVGILFCFEASRLSRNSPDWASVFHFCGHLDTLVVDGDQVYDLSVPGERAMLGIKGTMAEMELSIMQKRLTQAREGKAARGELKYTLPPGYVHDPDGGIVKYPDQRGQAPIHGVCEGVSAHSSSRRPSLWYRDTKYVLALHS